MIMLGNFPYIQTCFFNLALLWSQQNICPLQGLLYSLLILWHLLVLVWVQDNSNCADTGKYDSSCLKKSMFWTKGLIRINLQEQGETLEVLFIWLVEDSQLSDLLKISYFGDLAM